MIAEARATWLASLSVDATLPERVVVVRNEAFAHTWRRDLARLGHTALLLGTRFVTPVGVALEIVKQAGLVVTLGEEAIRPARIAALLDEPLSLAAFDLDVLREQRGWDRALASTIGELEAAGFAPDTLPLDDPHCVDLALIWRRVTAAADTSRSAAWVLHEATRLLVHQPTSWPIAGAAIAEITGHETASVAGFLRAIPGITLVSIGTLPQRSEHAQRVAAMFGTIAPLAPSLPAAATERDVLARYLFSPPELLASRDRPRSTAIDGTVHIEEHAGIEAELDATVTWAVAEIADRGIAIEQLAIVVPRLDPYATLLGERFDGALGPDAVHVVGGLPATGTASGARVATVLHALGAYLHLDTMVDVLPMLRLPSDESQARTNISRRDAIGLLYQLGTVGGGRANPGGALDWAARRTHRLAAVEVLLASPPDGDDVTHERAGLERTRDHLTLLAGPLAALHAAARCLVDDDALEQLWAALRTLFADHVRLGTDGKRILQAIDAAIAPLVAAGVLRGEPALDLLVTTLEGMRLPMGRFGEAKLTIGALADLAGLTFDSVRVLGLAEGVVPSSTREDPVLPDAVRARLGPTVRRTADRSLAQLHALHRVVLGTPRVVLSAPRMDIEGRYREPSGVLLEALAALGRPPLGQGAVVIPDRQLMRQLAFEPARAHADALRDRWPVDDRGRLTRAALHAQISQPWADDARFPLRPAEIAEPSVMDGWFPDGDFIDLPGLSEERPISASAFARLLDCPQRFLYERVLGWHPPPELVTEGSIDALSYGSLFHAIAEDFYRLHGAAFCAKTAPLDHWHQVAAGFASRHFAAFVDGYPLVGQDVQLAHQARLHRDVRALLVADWEVAKTFVDVERSFGPMPLPVGPADDVSTLYVRGFIDRIDTIGATTLVRDLKTGRAKPRSESEGFLPAYDLQLGLYGLVTHVNATTWSVPATIEAAYVYPSDASGDERSYADDYDQLATATASWMTIGRDLLVHQQFPRTPRAEDCTFCAFKPVCGPHATARAAALLAAPPASQASFAALKIEAPEDD